MADEYIKRTLAKAEFTGNFRDEYPTALIHALIDSVPAADVAPVRHGFDTGASRYFRCSECGYGVSDVFEDGPTFVFEKQKEWSYCPNCGAKMDAEVER